ncbi:MAG TPA: LPS assembly protein LptD, partial [Candidatus Hypogeohydataceae bacterium YC40]
MKEKIVPSLGLLFLAWLVFQPEALSQGIITVETTPFPITITAHDISTWQKEGVRVFMAQGDVWITQGKVLITADNATFWFYEQEALQQKEARIEVYCEGKVSLVQDKDVQHYEQLLVRLTTAAGLVVNPYIDKVKTFEEEQPIASYLQAVRARGQWKGEFALKEPVPQVTKEPGLVDIEADDIDSWVEGDKRIVSALGNVVLRRDDTTLEADNVILWFEQEEFKGKKKQVFKELYAEGNITLQSKEDVIKADKVFQNLPEKKGIFINPRIKTLIPLPVKTPIYIGGEEAKLIDQDRMLVKNCYFTTCSFGHPHYRFKSRNVTVTRRHTPTESYSEIEARQDTFLVGEHPVAYFPKYTFSTRTKPGVFRGISPGSSSRLGTFVSTNWDPLNLGFLSGLNRWSDMVVKGDYYSKRGPSVGSEFNYKRPNILGSLETFYLRDKLKHDINITEEPIENPNRGRVLWRDRVKLGEYWRADTELSFLSDRDFLREFYEREFKEGKEQETDLYIRRLEDNKSFTFLVKKQIEKFDTGLEALPQLSYQLISQPLWEDRLNFTSQSELGYLDFKLDDELNTRAPALFTKLQRTTGNSFRMDNNNVLAWPFQLWIWNLKPFVGGRITAYSKSLRSEGPNDGPPVGRLAASLGMDASTTFWRIYSLESKLLHINKLRHIITPEFRWEAGPVVTENPDKLLQYYPSRDPENLQQNPMADGLDTYNSFIIGIRNRLQTRRGVPSMLKTVDLLDLNLELHVLPSPKNTDSFVTHTVGNAEGFLIPEKDTFIQPEFKSQLTDRIELVSERNEFELKDLTFNIFSFGVKYQYSPNFSQFLGYRFLKDISSSVILGTNLVLKDKWGMNFTESYDLRAVDATGVTSTRNLGTGLNLFRCSYDWRGMYCLRF